MAIPSIAGIPTPKPPKIRTYSNGECDPFAPGKMKKAFIAARTINQMPRLIGNGFPSLTLIMKHLDW